MPPPVPAYGPDHRPDARSLRLLSGIAEGRTNTELASLVGVSTQSVKNQISGLLRGLRVPNRTAAVTLALQWEWLRLVALEVRRSV